MLAHLQQATTLGLLVLAALWLAWCGPDQPGRGVLGLLLLASGHAWFLALEFLLVHCVNRRDPAPRASGWALVRAWWRESHLAPRVFCWMQPFRAAAEPDVLDPATLQPGRVGVVFIHGFVCNRGLWAPWLRALRARGQAAVAVNLEPVFGGIDDCVPRVEAAVARVHAATGQPPVLVCHSMGGLAARAWLRALGPGAEARVRQVITLGTPHAGTWLGRFAWSDNGRQMREHSDWLRQLARDEPPGRYRHFVCWYSNCDNIVFPASTATLPGADNRFVPGIAHMALAFDPGVRRDVLALL